MVRVGFLAAASLLYGCGPQVAIPVENLGCSDAQLDTFGCEFAIVPPLHLVPGIFSDRGLSRSRWESDGIVVVNGRDVEARVQLIEAANDSDPERAVEVVRTLGPHEAVLIHLPSRESAPDTGAASAPAFVLQADAPVSTVLYAPYRSFVGNDSALQVPRNAWGTDYVVSTYAPHGVQFQGLGDPTYFDVVSLDSSVSLRWRPRAATTATGRDIPEVAPNTWSNSVALEPGVPLRVVAKRDPLDPHGADLSGTLIEATGPVMVQAGSRCSAVPIDLEPVSGCDPLLESMPPVSAWGEKYPLAHPPLRTNEPHHYRVFAGSDDIAISVEHGPIVDTYALPQKGSFADVVIPHGANAVVSANGPVLPVGYLQTRDLLPEIGDPAMYTVIPPGQFLVRQTVSTGVEWSTHWLQVVRQASEAPLVLDGETVGSWVRFGEFEVATLEVSEGVHELDSAQPFGVTQFGWTNEVHDACRPFAAEGTCQTSYAHPGAYGVQAD